MSDENKDTMSEDVSENMKVVGETQGVLKYFQNKFSEDEDKD